MWASSPATATTTLAMIATSPGAPRSECGSLGCFAWEAAGRGRLELDLGEGTRTEGWTNPEAGAETGLGPAPAPAPARFAEAVDSAEEPVAGLTVAGC